MRTAPQKQPPSDMVSLSCFRCLTLIGFDWLERYKNTLMDNRQVTMLEKRELLISLSTVFSRHQASDSFYGIVRGPIQEIDK